MSLPEPYYQDESCAICHGESRELLPLLEHESVDLVLTDPPFFMPAIHYQSRVKHQRAWADTSILATFWGVTLDLLVPLMKPTAHLLAFCNGDSYPVFYPEVYRRFDTLVDLVWDKERIGLGRTWRRRHELVLAARWKSAVFNEDGVLRSDVLRHKATSPGERRHPVEKPASLLADLILPTTQPNGLVLDAFMGSGTTLLAAKRLGRKAVGIEMEERYCEGAANLLTQSVLAMEA